MTNVYKISEGNQDYHGCGKAWAAITQDGEVAAIRYMGDFAHDTSDLPAWVQAVLDVTYLPLIEIKWLSPARLSRIKKAAIAAGHPEFGPRGGHIKASDIARKAQSMVWKSEHHQFGEYRDRCRAELEKSGEVRSGMASCYEFVARAN